MPKSIFHEHELVYVSITKHNILCTRYNRCNSVIYGKYYMCGQCIFNLCEQCFKEGEVPTENPHVKVVNCHKDIEKYGSLQVIYSERYFEEKRNN